MSTTYCNTRLVPDWTTNVKAARSNSVDLDGKCVPPLCIDSATPNCEQRWACFAPYLNNLGTYALAGFRSWHKANLKLGLFTSKDFKDASHLPLFLLVFFWFYFCDSSLISYIIFTLSIKRTLLRKPKQINVISYQNFGQMTIQTQSSFFVEETRLAVTSAYNNVLPHRSRAPET